LADANIYLHLDNHVSQAMWCCSLTDGNSWFGDTYFNTTKWTRGLAYMANHGKNWATFSSVGLRNELRLSLTGASTLEPYTWSTWATYMTAAASAVYAANPDVLIFFSGLDSDFNIEPIVGGSDLVDPLFSFHATDYEWADKFVLEIHEYDENISSSCFVYQQILLSFGFDATTKTGDGVNRAPLVIIVHALLDSWWRDSWVGCCGFLLGVIISGLVFRIMMKVMVSTSLVSEFSLVGPV
jgi:hypothetical protein